MSSGKGGVGKTCISTNLSIGLASQGKKVCLFDADTNLANVNILLGLSPEQTLEHYVKKECQIEDILLDAPGGIQIIPGATGIGDFVQLSAQRQKHLVSGLKRLESQFDYLIIDTGAGISEALIQFLLASPNIIITITHEPTSLTDAFSLLKVLKRHHFKSPVFVIVNMAQSQTSAHESFNRFKGAVAKYLHLKAFYLGFIFSDPKVPASIRAQKPYLLEYPKTLASCCLQAVCRRLSLVLEKKHHGKSFSEYFQSLHLDQDDDRLTPTASQEIAGTAPDINELLSAVGRLSPGQGSEFLINSLRNYCKTHPKEMLQLKAPIMQIFGIGQKKIKTKAPSPFLHASGDSYNPQKRQNILSPDPKQNYKSKSLWTACQLAAQLNSKSD